MNFGKLSLTHEILSKLYVLGLSISEDELLSKDEMIEDIKEIIDAVYVLVDSLSTESHKGQSAKHTNE